MFSYEGPVAAVRNLRAFMRSNGNKLKESLAENLDAAVDEISPVASIVAGMEWLYSALAEVDGDGALVTGVAPAAVRESALQTLGVLATAVGHGQFYGKGDRAWLIEAWAANELNSSPVQTTTPDVDSAYSFAPPAVPTPPAPPPA